MNNSVVNQNKAEEINFSSERDILIPLGDLIPVSGVPALSAKSGINLLYCYSPKHEKYFFLDCKTNKTLTQEEGDKVLGIFDGEVC